VGSLSPFSSLAPSLYCAIWSFLTLGEGGAREVFQVIAIVLSSLHYFWCTTNHNWSIVVWKVLTCISWGLFEVGIPYKFSNGISSKYSKLWSIVVWK
jgi:hypothetical protein